MKHDRRPSLVRRLRHMLHGYVWTEIRVDGEVWLCSRCDDFWCLAFNPEDADITSTCKVCDTRTTWSVAEMVPGLWCRCAGCGTPQVRMEV